MQRNQRLNLCFFMYFSVAAENFHIDIAVQQEFDFPSLARHIRGNHDRVVPAVSESMMNFRIVEAIQ